MAVINLKIPFKTKKVEIIKEKDLEKFLFRNFDLPEDFSVVIPDEQPAIPVESIAYYTNYFTFETQLVPTQISLEKFQQYKINLDEISEEIQSSFEKGFEEGLRTAKAELEPEIDRLKTRMLDFDLVTNSLKQEFLKNMKEFEETIVSTSVMLK